MEIREPEVYPDVVDQRDSPERVELLVCQVCPDDQESPDPQDQMVKTVIPDQLD